MSYESSVPLTKYSSFLDDTIDSIALKNGTVNERLAMAIPLLTLILVDGLERDDFPEALQLRLDEVEKIFRKHHWLYEEAAKAMSESEAKSVVVCLLRFYAEFHVWEQNGYNTVSDQWPPSAN